MILVTGGTGFVGQALVQHLIELGYPVRTLLRPSRESPNLPKNVQVEVVICSLNDQRSLRAAMRGVEFVIHLAGSERKGYPESLQRVDIEGTRSIVEVAGSAGIQRFFYLSHLGADRASGYPLLKAKAIAENYIVRSGLPYTIFRSALIYGPRDQFTIPVSRWIRSSPGILFLPEDGCTLLQPLWIKDLIHCISIAIESSEMVNQMYSIGGGDYLSFKKVVLILRNAMKIRRVIFPIPFPLMRILSSLFDNFPNGIPLSAYWLDYLATDRTTDLNVLPRVFGLLPAQFNQQIDYITR